MTVIIATMLPDWPAGIAVQAVSLTSLSHASVPMTMNAVPDVTFPSASSSEVSRLFASLGLFTVTPE